MKKEDFKNKIRNEMVKKDLEKRIDKIESDIKYIREMLFEDHRPRIKNLESKTRQ